MSDPGPKWTLAHKFYVDFNATASELASRLDALNTDLDVSPATVKVATSDLSRLTKALSDATGTLPSYDQRQCELLKALEKRIEALRLTTANTPKFSFKRKAVKPKPSTERASAVESPLANAHLTLAESTRALATFSHRYLTIFDVRSPDASAELSISDLDHCIVNLLPSNDNRTEITALHVQRVSRSVVLLPHIAGSIILHDLLGCVIVVGCHQFRMHDSTAVDVYLESTSDPIIEHCSGIRFAAYPRNIKHEETLQDDKHFAVKDFSHILPTPSPNWSVLLDEARVKSWPVSPLQGQALGEELERTLPTQ